MNIYCKVLLLLLLSIVSFISCRDIRIKAPRFDRFDGTGCGDKNVKIIFDYYNFTNIGRLLYMNSTITVKEDIPTPPTLHMVMKRCRSRENLDQCEDFHTFSTKKYCTLIQSDNELWNPFFATIVPKWKCPLKKGAYKSINSSFDLTTFLIFPVDGWFWRIRGEMLDGLTKKMIMCINVEGQVVYTTRTVG